MIFERNFLQWSRVLLVLGIALVAWSSIPSPSTDEAASSDHHSLRHRSLALSEFIDPKSSSPKQLVLPYVQFYIKTSGKPKYLERAVHIADTFGHDADGMTFLFDNHNPDEVDEFARMRPWVSIRHVEGTDAQGDYHGETASKKDLLQAAYRAQRIKTRAVFNDFLGTPEPKPDWVCYLDDDMLANVANLKVDLQLKQTQCSPDCLITDVKGHGGIQYTQGGWCMSQSLAARVAELLIEKNDEELGWTSTDDVSFNKDVLQKWLGVSPTDSERWWSELSWRKSDPKRIATEPLHGGSISAFNEKVVPSLAVYHIRYIVVEGV